ncbi:amidase family protein [Nocardia sp. NPDC005825]|uniref:amidase n=1 Tax=unclassified Nocardia TaxID=2637762 RepID=UPI0033C564C0
MTATEPCDLTAVDQRTLIAAGRLSARELLVSSLNRIEAVNPSVNAIVTLDREAAFAAAQAADDERARGNPRPALDGLVVAHKDMTRTAGMRTTMGSEFLRDVIPETDDAVPARMVAAGATRIGKTNVPEFGLGSHTVNAVFGATHNPYDLARSAGGSSGGAAAALATGMVSLADGGDMGGSLRNPASFCGVVGLRPSTGRVSTAPTTTAAPSMAVLGPMGRCVADTALLLSAIAGWDAGDPHSLDGDGTEFLTVAAQRPPEDLAGLRVGWSADLGGLPVDNAITEVITARGLPAFERLGASVDDWAADFDGADFAFRTLRSWSLRALLGPFVAIAPEKFGSNTHTEIEWAEAITADDVARAFVLQNEVRARARQALVAHDVLVAPVTQLPPFPIGWDWPRSVAGAEMDNYLEWMKACWYVTVTGLPALSLPCGFTTEGLPVGIQIIGRPHAERDLLVVAAAIEQVLTDAQKKPADLAADLIARPSMR